MGGENTDSPGEMTSSALSEEKRGDINALAGLVQTSGGTLSMLRKRVAKTT